MTRKRREILAAYDALNDGDMSTERLLAMVGDQCECEVDAIIDALLAGNRLIEAQP